MSEHLRFLFGISIPLFIAHGIEEYMTGFVHEDASFAFVFRRILELPTAESAFLVFQIMVWLLLIVSALLISGAKWQRRLLAIPGVLYVLETHHLFETIIRQSYYPGSVTAIAFPVLGFFFWKEYAHASAFNNS